MPLLSTKAIRLSTKLVTSVVVEFPEKKEVDWLAAEILYKA